MVVVQRNIAKLIFPTDSIEKYDYKMYFDGCSKGNPGPGGAGAVIYKNDVEIHNVTQYVGDNVTNNHAEYMGIIAGLNLAKENGIDSILVHGDSQLVIKQMRGEYKVKHPNLIVDYKTAKDLSKSFARIEYKAVPRKENFRADELANLGLANQ